MKKLLLVISFLLLGTVFYSCTGTGYVSTGVSYGIGSYSGYGNYGGYGGYGYRSTYYPSINRGYYNGGYRGGYYGR
ncbi:MAG TPA: hypothetical protein PKD83_10190 [Ignavibacteria bacterium]|nr:hypothetical protein [Ignavibacteria bacterium]